MPADTTVDVAEMDCTRRALIGSVLCFPAFADSDTPVLSRDIKEQANPFEWYPLAVGNRWVYDCTLISGSEGHRRHWTREVIVTGQFQTDEGILVLRKQTDRPTGREDMRDDAHYLVRSSYIYEVNPMFVNTATRTINSTIREQLISGDLVPSFFFPMRVGLLWAEQKRERPSTPADTHYFWHVYARGAGVGSDFPKRVRPTAYAIRYNTVASRSERWFEKSVGLVGETAHHGGSDIYDLAVSLRTFHPVRRTNSSR
jgi:hypothetical protein